MPLADAMAKSPDVFPRVYVAMVEAGETGGFLDVVLGQIADFQARDKELRGKVMAAMLYPCILLVMAISVLIFMLTFFIPRYQTMFAGLGGHLPLLTLGHRRDQRRRALVRTDCGARNRHRRVPEPGLVESENGKRIWERGVLRGARSSAAGGAIRHGPVLPDVGDTVNPGVPLINGLNVARRSIGNQVLVDAVSNSIERVKEGGGLGVSLTDCKELFPSFV